VTYLFEKTDKVGDGLSLDFQTNACFVSNQTNYEKIPRASLLDKILYGTKLELSTTMKFTELMDTLSRKNDDFRYEIKIDAFYINKTIIDANWDIQRDEPQVVFNKKIKYENAGTISGDLKGLLEWFGGHQRLEIDPESDLKVAIYKDRKGKETYVASLSMSVYTGISGAPGNNDCTTKVIKASVSPREN